MKNQKQYDRAVAMLDELEEILGYRLTGEDEWRSPVDDLWRAFATDDEKREVAQSAAKCMAAIRANESAMGRLTRQWAESKLLEHAEPLQVFEQFIAAHEPADGDPTIKPGKVWFKR